MARPDSISDIKHEDRFVRVATFEIDKIVANAALLKHYTSLLEAIQKAGGNASKSYSTVELTVPKDKQELEQQLASDQYSWDDSNKFYNLALNRGENSDEIPEWRRSSIKRWAKEQELPDPFDVFAANDPELQQMRMELGMESE